MQFETKGTDQIFTNSPSDTFQNNDNEHQYLNLPKSKDVSKSQRQGETGIKISNISHIDNNSLPLGSESYIRSKYKKYSERSSM